ncbi:MAG: 4-hydroxybenzoate octaprenyltransferase [Betaproteobacteria bacterium]|nr:4-hydroxybenzoate octaprenyltransferase [Betaproteobacteria bacterium]
MSERLKHYIALTRLNRPIGILLLLWPTLWALWISSAGHPDVIVLVVFVLGTVLMRSAGCAINDYADRDFDAHVKRTAGRPLAAKKISTKEALSVAAILALIAFLLVLLFLNRLTLYLSFAALFLAISYPFTKRFLAMPQAYLGIAFGFGIPMAFAAQTGSVPAMAWWMLLANIFWTLAYDTEYAMVDRDDDVKIGIKTTALLFGRYDVAIVMACYAAMLAILVAIGNAVGLGWPYFTGLVVACGIALFHYTLIRERQREQCFKAFLHNNWLGFAVFCGVMVDYAVRK